jgi:hypothetical protein
VDGMLTVQGRARGARFDSWWIVVWDEVAGEDGKSVNPWQADSDRTNMTRLPRALSTCSAPRSSLSTPVTMFLVTI